MYIHIHVVNKSNLNRLIKCGKKRKILPIIEWMNEWMDKRSRSDEESEWEKKEKNLICPTHNNHQQNENCYIFFTRLISIIKLNEWMNELMNDQRQKKNFFFFLIQKSNTQMKWFNRSDFFSYLIHNASKSIHTINST